MNCKEFFLWGSSHAAGDLCSANHLHFSLHFLTQWSYAIYFGPWTFQHKKLIGFWVIWALNIIIVCRKLDGSPWLMCFHTKHCIVWYQSHLGPLYTYLIRCVIHDGHSRGLIQMWASVKLENISKIHPRVIALTSIVSARADGQTDGWTHFL